MSARSLAESMCLIPFVERCPSSNFGVNLSIGGVNVPGMPKDLFLRSSLAKKSVLSLLSRSGLGILVVLVHVFRWMSNACPQGKSRKHMSHL